MAFRDLAFSHPWPKKISRSYSVLYTKETREESVQSVSLINTDTLEYMSVTIKASHSSKTRAKFSSLVQGPYGSLVPPSEWQPMLICVLPSSSIPGHPPTHCRSLSAQSNDINFGISVLLLPSGFPRSTSFTVQLSHILTTSPTHSSIHFTVVTIFGFLYTNSNSRMINVSN